ncbi:MAG: 2Fe-2S iron-sulfur cluster-binding protein [Bdellovibrionota bacterium]|nr:2Fe-2S iron-sulfur cluster-binding protein [Bdellovibrionota bacterium]
MPTVSFEKQTEKFQVNSGETIYDALHGHGRELPHGCLAGSCGACRIIITEGHKNLAPASPVEQDTIDSVLLNYQRLKGEEYLKGETLRLSCRAKILGDITIKLLG